MCASYALHTQYNENSPSFLSLLEVGLIFSLLMQRTPIHLSLRVSRRGILRETMGFGFRNKLLRSNCTLCDWECFRDPSELFGPILEMSAHPIHLGKKFYQSPEYFQYWYNDLKYYRACNYFNGRKAPNYTKLKIMAQKRPKK